MMAPEGKGAHFAVFFFQPRFCVIRASGMWTNRDHR
jgi:hypothetical protein